MTIGEGRQHGQNQTTWCAVPMSMGFSGKRSVCDKISTEKMFQIKKNSTNFYASERAHDLFTPASKRAIGIDKLAQKHVWQIRADTPIFEAKIYTKSLAGKYCKNSAGS